MASLLATRFFLNAKPDPKPKRLGLSRARNFYMCCRGGLEPGQTLPEQLSSVNETVQKFWTCQKAPLIMQKQIMKRQVFSFLFVTCTRGFEKHFRIILMGTSHQPVLPKNFTEGRCHKIRIYL